MLVALAALGGIAETAAADACPNAAVRAQQSSTLPDCRAYEQVSPVAKNGGDVNVPVRIGSDGTAISWISSAVYEPVVGSNGDVAYVGRRGSTGWTTSAFSAPFRSPNAQPFNNNQALGNDFNADLSTDAILTNASLDDNDQDILGLLGRQDLYLLDPSGNVTWLSHTPTLPDTGPFDAGLSGYDDAGTTYLFSTAEPLTDQVPGSSTASQLYRWRNGVIQAVGFDAQGNFLAGGSGLGAGISGGAQIGDVADSQAVSSDGTRFVFSGAENVGDVSQLYLHRDGGPTVELSLSQVTGSVGQPAVTGARFVAAASDLTRILFYSADQLTDTAPSDGGDYWYDTTNGRLSFSNPDDTSTFTGNPNGLVRVAPDGSRVYFVSGRVLASGATLDEGNLYVSTNGAISFIATLNGVDTSVASGSPVSALTDLYTAAGISGDGSRLVFQSVNQLTSYDNAGHAEIYLYDAGSGGLSCVSCRSDGSRPTGDATLIPPFNFGTPQTSQAITTNGDQIFFTTSDPLVPTDTNNQLDVYEYENGTVTLLSSGTAATPSMFAGISPDGTDAYFTTRDSLVPQDQDGGLTDMYDARSDGGFLNPDVTSACSGDACQGPTQVAAVLPVAGTVTFSGSGNVKTTTVTTIAAPPTPPVRIGKRSARGSAIVLGVKVPGKGRLSASGSFLTTVRRSVTKAATYNLTLRLTKKATATLRRKHRITVKVRIAYVPAAGRSSAASVALTVKG